MNLVKNITLVNCYVFIDGAIQAQSVRRGNVKHGFGPFDGRSDGVFNTHSFLHGMRHNIIASFKSLV